MEFHSLVVIKCGFQVCAGLESGGVVYAENCVHGNNKHTSFANQVGDLVRILGRHERNDEKKNDFHQRWKSGERQGRKKNPIPAHQEKTHRENGRKKMPNFGKKRSTSGRKEISGILAP